MSTDSVSIEQYFTAERSTCAASWPLQLTRCRRFSSEGGGEYVIAQLPAAVAHWAGGRGAPARVLKIDPVRFSYAATGKIEVGGVRNFCLEEARCDREPWCAERRPHPRF
jgi:hypothetical protein